MNERAGRDLDASSESRESGGQPDWQGAFKQAMRAFVRVRTQEDALAATLEQASFSLEKPMERHEFADFFLRGVEFDKMVLSTIQDFWPVERGGEAKPQHGALLDVSSTAIAPAPEHTSIMALFDSPEPKEPAVTLADEASMFFSRLRSQLVDAAYEKYVAQVEARNQGFLEVANRLSNGGQNIVIHGGNTVFSNGLMEVIKDSKSLTLHHFQELDRQNFYCIPLDEWVAFCEASFPEEERADTRKGVEAVISD